MIRGIKLRTIWMFRGPEEGYRAEVRNQENDLEIIFNSPNVRNLTTQVKEFTKDHSEEKIAVNFRPPFDLLIIEGLITPSHNYLACRPLNPLKISEFIRTFEQ